MLEHRNNSMYSNKLQEKTVFAQSQADIAFALREEELNAQIEWANKLLTQNPQETFALAQTILDAAGDYPIQFARALRTRAMASGAMGNLESSAEDFRRAVAMAQCNNDKVLEAQALHGIGNVHYYRGEFALALEQIHQANALRREVGDDTGLMTGLNSLGAFLAEIGDLQSAVSCFFDSLQISRRVRSGNNESLALTNIGHLKLENDQPEEAIPYLLESLQIAESVQSRIYLPFTLEILAAAQRRCRRWPEARAAAEKALQIAHELGNPHHEASALCVLATIYREQNETEPAEELLLRALDIVETQKAGRNTASIYTELGKLYIQTRDFPRAEHCLQQGLASAQQRDQKQQISELHQALSDLYTAVGDYEKAFASYKAYHEVYKTLQRESLQHRLEAQFGQLEVQRAQQEAELHRQRMVELSEANRENEKLLERIREQAKRLAEMAITDPLTGLYNRRYLREYLGHEIPGPPQSNKLLAIALLDLDNFKQINDRFSHGVGDMVLKMVGRLIQKTVRDQDIVVRFGGEEFVVIFPQLHRVEALTVCEQIRGVLPAYRWSTIHPQLQVTTSIGLVDTWEDAPPGTGESYHDRFLVLADKRLYRAKAAGKNRTL